MSVPELIAFFERYAVSSEAPVLTDTAVQSVERSGNGFRVVTNRGVWSASSVVVATGYCDLPAVPAASRGLAPSVRQMVPSDYRRPEQLPAGGVLVVGASSTGVQLADEIQRSGRQVTLAVGRHTRLPRRYRGRDILWWLDQLGVLSQRADAVHDIERSRHQPSLQLVGRPDHSSLDLAVLHDRGVRLVGRVRDIDGHRVSLADDLVATTAAADIKMAEILDADRSVHRHHWRRRRAARAVQPDLAPRGRRSRQPRSEGRAHQHGDLGDRAIDARIRGCVCPFSMLAAKSCTTAGSTPEAGLYVLGLNFQRRRNSSFIDGVGDDAWVIARADRSVDGARARGVAEA